MPRQTRAGQTLDTRVWLLLDDAARAAGVRYTVVQGSYSSSVGASAGTHAGGGAFDLRSRDYTRAQALRLVDELRRRNVCAWWRTPEYGWPASAGGPHIHGIVRDEPDLSPAARRQVADYDAGRNGLASHARDPHPRPPQAPYRPGAPPAPPPTPPGDEVTPEAAAALVRDAVAQLAPRLDRVDAATTATAARLDQLAANVDELRGQAAAALVDARALAADAAALAGDALDAATGAAARLDRLADAARRAADAQTLA